VIIEDAKPRGIASLVRRAPGDPNYQRSGGAVHLLEAAGFRGVRTLAHREGQSFVEGVKAAGA
jgi:hypothetical protein